MKSHKVCFIHTHTNGIHQTNEPVCKKNLFEFGRLIQLKYSIGYFEDDKFIEEKKEKYILKPKCITFDKKAQEIHKIKYKKAMEKGHDNVHVMMQFRKDLNNVDIIIGHNLNFHLRAIQVELFRAYTYIDFNNYTLADMISFGHSIKPASLVNIAKHFNIDTEKYTDIKLMKKVFPKLYKNYLNENNGES
jgi:hypothetical protein